ncbi:MAG: hypothetical protein LBS83_03470 [Holosporales bacterium]|nr:hypothetical protein [Holosporales bacterium]
MVRLILSSGISTIPKPQKIADLNFLGFKDWQQFKSALFGSPSIYWLPAGSGWI